MYSESDFTPIIMISTIHSSKGLDFKNVFIPNMDHRAFVGTDANTRAYLNRLLFVAVTRTRENLFLSYSSYKPAPFLNKVPKDIYNLIEIDDNDEQIENKANKQPFIEPHRQLETVDDGVFF
ncbi:MAG: ATP-binding domain-containing protein [Deltaproteobacteria bacterium]|jgi:superfamily I DNA/RNA helicase|nr:ATP-binding domain-containing protein [Deltaproteobacteria bacterium]